MYNPLIYYLTNDKLRKGIIAVIRKKDLENFSTTTHQQSGLHHGGHHRRSNQLISMAGRYISSGTQHNSDTSQNSSKNNSFETTAL